MAFPSQYLINFRILCLSFHLDLNVFLVSVVISSFTYWLFNSVLFHSHTFVNFPFLLLVLVSIFIHFLLEKILHIILIFVIILRFVLWPDTWPAIENVSHRHEKCQGWVFEPKWGWETERKSPSKGVGF